MPTFTLIQSSVRMLNRLPDAFNCTPRYGTLNRNATITVRMRMAFPPKMSEYISPGVT